MSAQLEKRHFNVAEYYQMAKAGVLKPDDRVELIEGEVVKMSPIGSAHAACVARSSDALRKVAKPGTIIWVQNPIRLSAFSEPVPDLVLLRARKDYYAARHPKPTEALLIIEVADTTVLTDRNVKVPLYARAGIPETWVVNIPKEIVEVYFDLLSGKYRQVRKFKRGEVVESPTIRELSLSVNAMLG